MKNLAAVSIPCVHGSWHRSAGKLVNYAPLPRFDRVAGSECILLHSKVDATTAITPEDVIAANSVFVKCVPFVPLQMCHLAEYTVKKLEWMARHGLHREAIHTLWVCIGRIGAICRQRDDTTVVEKAVAVGREWLRAVGWVGKSVLREKLKTGKVIIQEVEASAADLLQARNTLETTYRLRFLWRPQSIRHRGMRGLGYLRSCRGGYFVWSVR